ncbi:MAG: hypothetical protein ABFE08_23580 [Armatimonadia bacterium]
MQLILSEPEVYLETREFPKQLRHPRWRPSLTSGYWATLALWVSIIVPGLVAIFLIPESELLRLSLAQGLFPPAVGISAVSLCDAFIWMSWGRSRMALRGIDAVQLMESRGYSWTWYWGWRRPR